MTIARVQLWGKSIGAVSWDESAGLARFEYDPGFVHRAIGRVDTRCHSMASAMISRLKILKPVRKMHL